LLFRSETKKVDLLSKRRDSVDRDETETTIGRRIMNGEGLASHITVTFMDGSRMFNCVYAVSRTILRDLEYDRKIRKNLTGKKLQTWLESNGCQLDSHDGGPAVVVFFDDGSIQRDYFYNGKLHRRDGPARVFHHVGELTVQEYCQEEYYCNGTQHRDCGPALMKRYADGWTEEQYFRDGEFIKKEEFSAPPLVTSGIMAERPAPRATTSGPGPA
jgi:hypothetical protein